MFYLNKIVGWVMSPIGVLFLGMGVAWMLGVLTQRRRGAEERRGVFGGRLRRGIVGATLVAFWILGCGVTTRLVGVPLEGEEAPEAGTLQVGGYDAVVVLGGGIGKHEKCGRTELFGGADRAWVGARRWKAYQDGNMPLICTGVGCAEATIPFLVDLGVPREAIVGFEGPRNTEEEAKLIAERGMKRVLLVTSAWHMPRAKMLFERAGLEVVEAPCDYEMHYAAERELEIGDFFPNAESLQRNSYAIKEWVARVCYAVLRR